MKLKLIDLLKVIDAIMKLKVEASNTKAILKLWKLGIKNGKLANEEIKLV